MTDRACWRGRRLLLYLSLRIYNRFFLPLLIYIKYSISAWPLSIHPASVVMKHTYTLRTTDGFAIYVKLLSVQHFGKSIYDSASIYFFAVERIVHLNWYSISYGVQIFFESCQYKHLFNYFYQNFVDVSPFHSQDCDLCSVNITNLGR